MMIGEGFEESQFGKIILTLRQMLQDNDEHFRDALAVAIMVARRKGETNIAEILTDELRNAYPPLEWYPICYDTFKLKPMLWKNDTVKSVKCYVGWAYLKSKLSWWERWKYQRPVMKLYDKTSFSANYDINLCKNLLRFCKHDKVDVDNYIEFLNWLGM